MTTTAVTVIPIHSMGRPFMPPQSDVARRQTEILTKLESLSDMVAEVANQGKEYAYELKLLRRELGVDGPHGRIPQIESLVKELDLRVDNIKMIVDQMVSEGHFRRGKAWVIATIAALLTSSGVVAIFEAFVKGHLN